MRVEINTYPGARTLETHNEDRNLIGSITIPDGSVAGLERLISALENTNLSALTEDMANKVASMLDGVTEVDLTNITGAKLQDLFEALNGVNWGNVDETEIDFLVGVSNGLGALTLTNIPAAKVQALITGMSGGTLASITDAKMGFIGGGIASAVLTSVTIDAATDVKTALEGIT